MKRFLFLTQTYPRCPDDTSGPFIRDLARALVRRPRLLILDEPTTALDPRTEAEICRTLRKLTGDELTIVAISHQKAVMEVADITYELAGGRLLRVGGEHAPARSAATGS